MKKIFVVEDDENIRELILYALNTNEFEAIGFECSKDFFVELNNNKPDLIILDIMLPDEDGLSILKKLRINKKTSNTIIIMITAKSSEYDKVRGLDLGADDYITKPFSVLELLSRIKAFFRRMPEPIEFSNVNKKSIAFENIYLDIEKHIVMVNETSITLTFKEFELLQLLMLNKGIVLSREKIMERVWGFDFEGESRTVDMHIKTLRQKLGESGKLIETIRGIGYKIGE